MKTRILILLLCLGTLCKANMSSPIWEGTKASSAFSSKDIDILGETIRIKIDKDYKTARYIVEYSIKSEVGGKQVPLLFFAQDYKDSFRVWLDGQPVSLLDVPEQYIRAEKPPFNSFAGSFEKGGADEPRSVSIYWDKNPGYVYTINDLKYFEANINKGVHKVRVEYTASVWTDISGWVKEYSFRYSLTPARFWKSFGTLNVQVEQEGVVRPLVTNLGQPNEKEIGATNSWTFNQLPGEYLKLSYTPETGSLAKTLMGVGPFGLTMGLGLVLFMLHLYASSLYRRRHLHKKYSLVVILGSLLVPFLILIGYVYTFDVIDNAIGSEAGRHHGYVSLVVFLYPLLMPFYWIVLWLIDRRYKQKLLFG